MRRLLILSLALAVMAGIATAGEKPWMDMENCAFCKSMTSKAGLMESVNCEQLKLDNGVVMITTVPGKHLADYRTAYKEMQATGERMMAGEKMEVCGSCTALGECFMMGAKQQYVESKSGDVWIVTSENPELVTKLHNWVDRNNEEMKKMKGAHAGHEGHDHG